MSNNIGCPRYYKDRLCWKVKFPEKKFLWDSCTGRSDSEFGDHSHDPSSSRIYPYEFEGKIIKGHGRGEKELGIPTGKLPSSFFYLVFSVYQDRDLPATTSIPKLYSSIPCICVSVIHCGKVDLRILLFASASGGYKACGILSFVVQNKDYTMTLSVYECAVGTWVRSSLYFMYIGLFSLRGSILH